MTRKACENSERGGKRSRSRLFGVWAGIIVLLLIGVVLFVISCRTVAPEHKIVGQLNVQDGTFVGEAFKFPGKMLVSVKIEKGCIVGIAVDKQIALKKYTDLLQPFIDRVIEQQSTGVDDITGATISSRALRRAVNDALEKARRETK